MSNATIVLTGGGSGGHITPLIAVADELKVLRPDVRIIYVGQKGDILADIPAQHPAIDEVYSIRAGKFRRYNGEGWRQIFDVGTLIKNTRDFFYVLIGFYQSRRLLKRLKPSCIFVKGGFVVLPVGLAAASLGLKYVTHDSDSIPGLANRIIARWAEMHAVAMPVELYNYPIDKTVSTGIPVRKEFHYVSEEEQVKLKSQLNVPKDSSVALIIGGGLGAKRLNESIAQVVPHLLQEHANLYIFHVVGKSNKIDMKNAYDNKLSTKEQGRLKIIAFLENVYSVSGAADVIITRAGATNLAEFAVQGKACIVVPSAVLVGGHQIKNAQFLSDKHAALVVSEEDIQVEPNRIAIALNELLENKQTRVELGANLHSLAHPDASRDIANILIDFVKA